MTTADWALIVSLFSMAISLASLVWSVWSKFLYPRARLRVFFIFSRIVHKSDLDGLKVLSLNVTNFGPTSIVVNCAIARPKRKYFRIFNGYSMLNPLHDFPVRRNHSIGPFSGGLPKKLEVGEEMTLYLTANHDGIAGEEHDRVGVADSFGRRHWAPKKQFSDARAKVIDHIEASSRATDAVE